MTIFLQARALRQCCSAQFLRWQNILKCRSLLRFTPDVGPVLMRAGILSEKTPTDLKGIDAATHPAGRRESNQMIRARSLPWCDFVTALLLFLATAIVILWQTSRFQVLFDLSYILENSYRISLGDLPYRDFPLPQAPLTFLIQAALIKL